MLDKLVASRIQDVNDQADENTDVVKAYEDVLSQLSCVKELIGSVHFFKLEDSINYLTGLHNKAAYEIGLKEGFILYHEFIEPSRQSVGLNAK